MNNTPLITVILPAFNCEAFIGTAIKSIVEQSYRNFELIIIEDGSTDHTLKIVESCRDPRIKLIKNQLNQGLARSLNIGIRQARGKYLARMDGDDVSMPDRFAKQVDFMEKNLDVVVCGGWMESFEGHEIFAFPVDQDDVRFQLLYGPPVAHPTVMMRRSVLNEHELFYDESFAAAQDYELWSRVSAVGGFANIPQVLLRYRKHADQVSRKMSEVQEGAANIVRKRELNRLGVDVTDEDIVRHTDFFRGAYAVPHGTLSWVENWIGRLITANRKSHVFEQDILKKLLAKKLWKFCQSASVTGLDAWKVLRSSQVYGCLDLDHYATSKFLLKCVLFQTIYRLNGARNSG